MISRPASNNRSFNYFLFIIGMNGLFGSVVGFFLPIYFKELGFSGFQIGFYFAITSIATILLSLPMGISTDRKSIVKILMISLFLIGLSKLGFVITRSYLLFCIFALIGSFGGRFYGTAINTLFFKMTGKDNDMRAGLFQLITYITIGLAMMAGGFLIQYLSFSAMFMFSFVANFVLMILVFFLPRNETVVIKLDEYKKAVLKPDVLFLTLVLTLSSIHWGAETVSYGPFLMTVLHLNPLHTGIFTALGFFFVGFGAVFGVFLLRKKIVPNTQTLLAVGFLLSGLFHILMCVHNVYWSFFFRAIHETGDGMISLAYYNGITKVFHLDKIGGCASFITLWQSIGSMSSAIVFGMIGERYGQQWPLIISGIISAVLPFMLWKWGKDLMKDQNDQRDSLPYPNPVTVSSSRIS